MKTEPRATFWKTVHFAINILIKRKAPIITYFVIKASIIGFAFLATQKI